jgi:thiamine-phosphate pyrophosphorylase
MFAHKKKYFLIIKSIRDINLRKIKKYNKFIIIYRNKDYNEKIVDLLKFRKECRLKLIKFYVANNLSLCVRLNSDGIYLSSYNKDLKILRFKRENFDIIGSAHNIKEIYLKKKQRCNYILFSKLFMVDYAKSSPIIGTVKFNKYLNYVSHILVPLGGIKTTNLNSLKNINSEGFAVMSEIKKKPAKIINRLF